MKSPMKKYTGQGMWEGVQGFHSLSRHVTLPAPPLVHQPEAPCAPHYWDFYGGFVMIKRCVSPMHQLVPTSEPSTCGSLCLEPFNDSLSGSHCVPSLPAGVFSKPPTPRTAPPMASPSIALISRILSLLTCPLLSPQPPTPLNKCKSLTARDIFHCLCKNTEITQVLRTINKWEIVAEGISECMRYGFAQKRQ